jgi:hypothetical protein
MVPGQEYKESKQTFFVLLAEEAPEVLVSAQLQVPNQVVFKEQQVRQAQWAQEMAAHKDSKNPISHGEAMIGKRLGNLGNCNQWFLLIDLVKVEVEVKAGASSL